MSDMKTLTIGANTWTIPVTSVNGQTGDVVLDASDVGAATEQDIADAIIQVLPVDSVSGSIASFPDGYPAPVESLSCAITPVQDLHGQSAPYPPGGGKNLFDMDAAVDGYLSSTGTAIGSPDKQNKTSDFIPVTAGETYTYTAYPTSMNEQWTGWAFYSAKDMGTSLGTRYTAMTIQTTVTAPTGANYIRIGSRYLDGGKAQFEKGSTATSYAPYSNVCPISGHTQAVVTDDPAYGGDINFNQWAYNGDFASITGWGESGSDYRNMVLDNGWAKIAPTNNQSYLQFVTNTDMYSHLRFVSGHKYLVISDYDANVTITDIQTIIYAGWTAVSSWTACTMQNGKAFAILTATGDATSNARFLIMENGTFTGGSSYGRIKNVGIFDLTQMFGAGNEPATVADFKALFPKDYYPYNAGETTCVSAVNGDPYRQITVDLSGTRYGGTLDVKSGVLTVTHGYTDLGDYSWTKDTSTVVGKTLFRTSILTGAKSKFTAICSNYPFVGSYSNLTDKSCAFIFDTRLAIEDSTYSSGDATAFKTAMSGVQLVYELATPLSVQLTPAELSTLLGQNNVWANCGDVSVTYRADIQKYIDKKLS